MTNLTTSTRSYYPALDGLRGIAILLVICCHNLDFLPHFEFGRVGVDLFFVLSGFLITDILLNKRESKNFLQNFYIRRILKIFPLYYGVLLLFFVVAPALQSLYTQYNYYHGHQALLWLHLQNWLSIIHRPPGDSMVLNHFWSLSVEEQFYLFWPFVILAIKDTRRLAQIAFAILITCILCRFSSWLSFGNNFTAFYFQYMTHVDGICIGTLIALWRFSSHEQSKKKIIHLALLAAGSYILLFTLAKTVFHNLPTFPFLGYTMIAVIFGLIVFFAVEKRNIYSKLLLENPVLKFFGRISYGLYVYHWPILVLSKIYLLNILVNHGFSQYSAYVTVSSMAIVVALIVSVLSYYLFERKLLGLKDVMTQEGFFERAWKKLLLFFSPSSSRS